MLTEWAVRSYMELRRAGVFSTVDDWTVLRPDIELLRTLESRTQRSERFRDARFWGPAESGDQERVLDGWKLKWHNFGTSRVQLRLYVAVLDAAYLCEAFVKTSQKLDYRKGAVFEDHVERIRAKAYVREGEL